MAGVTLWRWLRWGKRNEPPMDAVGDGGSKAEEDEEDAPDSVAVPLTDELDLHHFRPSEVADLVDEYLRAAHEAGLRRVRIIHGKGTGTLRRTVHAVLGRHPAVAHFALADERSGSWGATIVDLRGDP